MSLHRERRIGGLGNETRIRNELASWGALIGTIPSSKVPSSIPFLTPVRGDIIYANSAPAWAKLAITTTSGRFLRSDGTDVGWSTLALPNAATVGDIPYGSAANTLAMLADVATGNALISGGVGVAPSWGKIGLTTHVSEVLPIANGGTNATSFSTTNGIVYFDGTSLVSATDILRTAARTLNIGNNANGNSILFVDGRGGASGRAIVQLYQNTNTNQPTVEAAWGINSSGVYTAPSANQILFNFDAYAGDSASIETNYARFACRAVTVTNGAERGSWEFWVTKNGSMPTNGQLRVQSDRVTAGADQNDTEILDVSARGGSSGLAVLGLSQGTNTTAPYIQFQWGINTSSVYTAPGAGQIIGDYQCYAGDSGAGETLYGRMALVAATVTAGSERGRWDFYVTVNGTSTNTFQVLSTGAQVPSTYFFDALSDDSTGGYRAGSGSDVLLYRDAADTWRTPDSFSIDGTLGVGITAQAAGIWVRHATVGGRIEVSDTGTNNQPTVIDYRHITSGTAAANFGITVQWTIENGGGTATQAAIDRCDWITATAGSEALLRRWYLQSGGTIGWALEIRGTATVAAYNYGFVANAAGSYGGGLGVIFVANANTAPTSSPSGGGILYSTGGAGTWRGSGGTTTTFGPAKPYCDLCGLDSWRVATWNVEQGWYFFECANCTTIYRSHAPGMLSRRMMLSQEQEGQTIKRGMTVEEIDRIMS